MNIDADLVTSIVLDAACFFRDRDKVSHVAVKGYGNFVTDADKAVQRYIQEKLAMAYPSVQFFAEEKENGDVDVAKDFWILDPIDGTLNLMHDFAHSAISLGYAEKGVLTFGVIYDPYRDEVFRAQAGHGAYMMRNASRALPATQPLQTCVWQPIHVSQAASLVNSVVLVGTAPYHRDELGKKYFQLIENIFMHCEDIRRFGAAVLDLAWVACGRADAYFEHVYPWDRAAGVVIVKEAGGKVCSFDGTDVPVTTFHDVCVGPAGVVDEITGMAQGIFL